MSTCPSGHASVADDWCDVCGARIGAPATASPNLAPNRPPNLPAEPSGGNATGAAAGGEPDVTCPHCGITQDAGHRFCEVCGADMTTGAAPATPAAAITPPAAADSTPTAGGAPAPLGAAAGAARWEVAVAADRAYFDRLGADGVDFPVAAPPRAFPLADASVLVGRRSARRGIEPQIDLSGAPEDPGVSHAHCTLVRQPDGSYALVDNGSTNGTRRNDGDDPVAPHTPIALADGDRVHVGAWTTLTIRRR